MDCLRCGNCCIRHPAYVSPAEIRRITSYLGITTDDWSQRYAGEGPDYHGFFPIRQIDGACVFLRFDGDIAVCTIHSVKPDCCVRWAPGLDKEECRQGHERISGSNRE
ncbi:MAG: YkgJ family cysteine cluster protein [Dehalococcoidia bacterium]|jgi:Fe-S-cluster containining protein